MLPQRPEKCRRILQLQSCRCLGKRMSQSKVQNRMQPHRPRKGAKLPKLWNQEQEKKNRQAANGRRSELLNWRIHGMGYGLIHTERHLLLFAWNWHFGLYVVRKKHITKKWIYWKVDSEVIELFGRQRVRPFWGLSVYHKKWTHSLIHKSYRRKQEANLESKIGPKDTQNPRIKSFQHVRRSICNKFVTK